METKYQDRSLKFLSRGGEMGKLMREKDWSQTILGSPECWPQSLRTVLSLMLNSKFPMFLFWGKELICFYNDAYRPSLGFDGKHPNILGMNGKDAWGEIWDIIKPLIDQVLGGGEATWSEDQLIPIYRNSKIENVYWTFSYSPVVDETGMITGVFVTCNETTEKVNTLKATQESEKRFRLLADVMPQLIWISDGEGNPNYFNHSVFNYSGLNHDQLNKGGWIQMVHPDDREKTTEEWLKTIRSGTDFLMEHRFRRHDGEYRWQLSRAIPQKDELGKIQMWVGTSLDIQEQRTFAEELEKQVQERTYELKQSNESLKKSEERYHLMVEEVQDYAILYLNREGIVENWNSGAEKIKGYKANEIIGKSFSNFYTQEDQESGMPQKLLGQARDTGKARQEGWRVRKDRSLFWASVLITAVHNEQKEVIGFSKVTHDLTEKKNAEDALKKNAAQLEHKNLELEKMNKELQSFAYISSHDLQEPLRKIQTFATRIAEKESDNLSEHGKDYFNRMQRAALRMQTLIDDLLAYSRTNTAERKFERVHLSKIVDEVKSDLREELQHKNATMEEVNLCEVRIIPFQFRQLLHNLISNALKFSKTSQPPQIIIKSEVCTGKEFGKMELEEDKLYCHISISDNGIGFEQQFSEKIFKLFQRLHGKSVYPGTGIGLSIVKKIVENHYGIITATSEPHKGATFDIYMPAA